MFRLWAIAGLVVAFLLGTGSHQVMEASLGSTGSMMVSIQPAATTDGQHRSGQFHGMQPCHGPSCSQPFVMALGRIAMQPKIPSQIGTLSTGDAPPFFGGIEPPVPRASASVAG